MGQKVDLRLAALLDEAETRTSCLVPANDADRKALDRRKPAEVICPRPGLYARRAKWELLKRHPDIRALMVVRGLATQHPDWVFCARFRRACPWAAGFRPFAWKDTSCNQPNSPHGKLGSDCAALRSE